MAIRKQAAKKTAKKTAKKSARKAAKTSGKAPSTYRVRIRMYRQGLGDCFLLSFPTAKGKHRHMMIDCGVVLGTSDPSVVMKQVAEDIVKETGGRLDVLVITHEHWDHLSGFDGGQARAVFDGLEIGALWLAWTEKDGDALADDLRRERKKKLEAAKLAKDKLRKLGKQGTRQAERMEGVLGLFGATGAAGGSDDDGGDGTAGALAYLKSRCAPTILETGAITTIPGVKGARVFVLGPPKDKKQLRQTNPYKGEGYGLGDATLSLSDSFLAAFDPKDEIAQPFPFQVRKPALSSPSPASAAPSAVHQVWSEYLDPEHAWRNIDDAWLATGERLALQLDNATNNTSLVLAIELEGQDVLLFVGDAQAGNWRSWESNEWKPDGGRSGTPPITSADLLARTIFYKVGHHGSHNATMGPKGLELMNSERLAAVIPVDTKVAHEVKGWKHMPLPKIRERLGNKCSILFQSDEEPMIAAGRKAGRWIHSKETFEVRRKNKKTKKTETVATRNLYTDYFL